MRKSRTRKVTKARPDEAAGRVGPRWGISETNLLVLLISLFLSLMVTPVLEHYFAHRALVYASVSLVLISGVFMNRKRHWLFVPSIVFVILTVSVTWSSLVIAHSAMFVVSCILEAIVYGAFAVLLLIDILRRHLATVASVFGAICVYLLVGLAFAQLYWASERMDGESLSYAHPIQVAAEPDSDAAAPYSQMVYFSFVTMSTLGYGDIHPITPLAQTLAWMQSVIGQFYLAALVAWLISAIPRQDRAGESP